MATDLNFAVSSWYYSDEIADDESPAELKLYMFGRVEDGRSITVKIHNFTPSFYIRLPDEWSKIDCIKALEYFKMQQPEDAESIVSVTVDKYHDLHEHFCDNKMWNFQCFYFKSATAWYNFGKVFNKTLTIPGIRGRHKFNTYEMKVDPIISFIITNDLNSANWNIVSDYELCDPSGIVTTDIFVQCDYKNVRKYPGDKVLPAFVTMSFDIECTSGDGTFPQAIRVTDKIISICGTVNIYGSATITKKVCVALDSTRKIPDTKIYCYSDESDMLVEWKNIICEIDPDFITGFNIFGFDNKYMDSRARQNFINCVTESCCLSRLCNYQCEFKKANISSAGLGDNEMYLWVIPGREQFDCMKLIQQDKQLTEYSLNKCCEEILKSEVTVEKLGSQYKVNCKTGELIVGNYVKFQVNGYMIEHKHEILEVHDNYIIINNEVELASKCNMCMSKDDMGPQEIFDTFPLGPEYRKKIHQYCIQDCVLVNKLCHVLDFITLRMALGNVASVPFNYIIMRGQGIKTLALFAKKCKKNKYLIRDLKPDRQVAQNGGKMGYEGATVLDPKKGFYERPLTTLDFNSLYPSVEIAYDMSHENLVTDESYMNLPNYHYRTLEYKEVCNKVFTGKMIKTTFATLKTNIDDATGNQIPGKHGIVGSILTQLLTDRKKAKKDMAIATDPQTKQNYSGKEKALKITANSIYGQLGSGVSPVSCVPIAAATTAGGRLLLQRAKDHIENRFKPILVSLYNAWKTNDLETVNDILDEELEDRCNEEFLQLLKETVIELFAKHDIFPNVAYGDTDSNFNDFMITNKKTGVMPTDRWCRIMCMKLGQIEEKLLKKHLPYPNNMAYEKVIHPMALMAKKNYMGHKYEDDPDKFKILIMGYKLKRRDGSLVFHKVVNSAVSKALNEIDPKGALEHLKQSLNDVVDGKFPITDFITTSLLRAKYKGLKLTSDDTGKKGEEGSWFWYDVKCTQKHVNLCQRMKKRDPGTAPQMNSRIPYVYIVKEKTKHTLQADLIEHPDFIIKNNLKIDYLFYITNQIRNPAVQFFSLISNDIDQIFDDIIAKEMERNDIFFQKLTMNINKNIFNKYGFTFKSDEDEE